MLSFYYNKLPVELQEIIDSYSRDDNSFVIRELKLIQTIQDLIDQLIDLTIENSLLAMMLELEDSDDEDSDDADT